MKSYRTNYRVATNWIGNHYILCNEIPNIDESVYDNARFDMFDEEEGMAEISQWFLSDCSQDDVEYLENHFGLRFTYSDKLDLYVLCVTHYGTAWDYVGCDTDLKLAARELGEEK